MDASSSDASEPGAPWRALDSLSVSGNTACAPQPSSPQQSNLQPSTHPDQLQELLKLAEDVATYKLRLTADDEPIKFSISRESWLKLQEDSNFDLCTGRKLFRFFFDSSRYLVTIMPPPCSRHDAMVYFLQRVPFETSSDLMSTLMSKIWIQGAPASLISTGEYESSVKQPDLCIDWEKNMLDRRRHTIVEVGKTQTLQDLRYLARFYLNNDANIQRVILIDITETPPFQSPKSIDISQGFQEDEETGVVWFGNAKIIGQTKILWEVWERDSTGVPQSTFEETFAFGKVPLRDLPFFTIPEGGVYCDTTIRREVDVPIKPEMIQKFWTKYWGSACWVDVHRRMFGLLGEQRLKEALEEARARHLARLSTGPS
ncbi:hypothetical protein AYL99_11641 [Fonsecaea erecta]|uniref:Uncharacterized protein n=1 Tax=Fonsecaea erecta TaxID=1367422 RepID=A0A178Z3P3_9EURO|nr:hypothetical protein AYL99_11641 [Fonsecaea erecta]OAP54106.1 hypothetical protein AYL99_11641 [Fonsecaea erecta]